MLAVLQKAGFSGIESSAPSDIPHVIYARTEPHLPEFTATRTADGWMLALSWPLRATVAQLDQWNALCPETPLDLFQGETRLQMRLTGDAPPPEALALWAARVTAMVAKCTQWRRSTRQRDEGM